MHVRVYVYVQVCVSTYLLGVCTYLACTYRAAKECEVTSIQAFGLAAAFGGTLLQ